MEEKGGVREDHDWSVYNGKRGGERGCGGEGILLVKMEEKGG
jgi:hypothetical protein